MPTTAVCPNPSCGKKLTIPDGIVAPKCPKCRTLVAPPRPSGTIPAAALTTPRSGDPAPPAARSTDKPPERVGRFVILGKLGAGAFGTVYRARDPQLDREVALKVPNAGVLSDPKRVERFLREAKAAAQLRHPNIVPVFDAGRDGDQYFIASSFIDGTPLSEAIGERGMDLRRAAEIVRELAGAVGYAHEQGIVHRDIKPSNVMLDAHDRPHLMDFGLAARADEAEKLTSDGAVMGTPAYMSPEQAGGQRSDPTPAWDQYALGVVLYELLTGRTPFSGPPAAVIYQVLNNDPPSPRSVRPDTPRDIETICLKAMARQSEHRYKSCAELGADLYRWLNREPITARKRGPLERAASWVRENDTVAALGAVTFAAMALGTILALIFAGKAQRRLQDAEQARETLERTQKDLDANTQSYKAVARHAGELTEKNEELTRQLSEKNDALTTTKNELRQLTAIRAEHTELEMKYNALSAKYTATEEANQSLNKRQAALKIQYDVNAKDLSRLLPTKDFQSLSGKNPSIISGVWSVDYIVYMDELYDSVYRPAVANRGITFTLNDKSYSIVNTTNTFNQKAELKSEEGDWKLVGNNLMLTSKEGINRALSIVHVDEKKRVMQIAEYGKMIYLRR